MKATLFNAAAESAKRFGKPPNPFRVTPLCTGAINVPGVVKKKLVGKLNPFPTDSGNPECHRARPVTSQPPMRASTARLALEPNFFPRPKGKSTTNNPLKLCLIWKSESPRPARRSNGF